MTKFVQFFVLLIEAAAAATVCKRASATEGILIAVAREQIIENIALLSGLIFPSIYTGSHDTGDAYPQYTRMCVCVYKKALDQLCIRRSLFFFNLSSARGFFFT